MVNALVRADEAFADEELVAWLRRRLDDAVLDVVDEFETLTVVVAPEAWVEAHRICREEPRLAFTMFDTLFGVDAKDEGFDVVSILYSVETGTRILLRTRVPGGRENPVLPSVTSVFRGANFHEREQWDMFGIEFEGHPGLAPRIFTAENFEGWPLRKDFHLATREAKPWPGVKEPAETDEDGNVIEKVPGIGEAVGPMPLDELMAEQARTANPELVAAQDTEAEVAEEAPAAEDDGGDEPPTTGDELKAEAEQVEAAVLSERTASGHADIAHHGAGDGGTAEVEANAPSADGELAGVADPDAQRAAAAEHRAEKAREIAQSGLATGTGDGESVPAGDPNQFGGHGREPGDTPKDLADVQAARDRGELPDEAEETRAEGVEHANPAQRGSLADGHSTDQDKDGANPADDGPVGRDEAVSTADATSDDAADADTDETDEEQS